MGNDFSLHPMDSDGFESVRAMVFWIIAVLSVLAVLAMVWSIYLLFRHWL